MEIMTGYEKLGQNHLRQISYRDNFARMMGYHFLHFHLTYLRDFCTIAHVSYTAGTRKTRNNETIGSCFGEEIQCG